uniref:Uncharacterized protein AlNc14C578G12201 n=1 Tax=Albugo laibachii Nc14 TaxID=890382 RepID=F0X1B2_9STRA|nr:conserved hypothetical protein [Albugo laibachii Nc14]|eukprot:CCA27586.1 conserved hypothetical protein [Albugo laibachii Nc14]
MFLRWIEKCELVPTSPESHVLLRFSETCQRGLCSIVVNFLTSEDTSAAEILPTRHHILWAMEIIGHSFALPMENSDIIFGALCIYEKWLAVDVRGNLSPTKSSPSNKGMKEAHDHRPPCMLPVEQSFIQDILGQMTLIFEERAETSRSSGAETSIAKQASLCSKVLDIFDAIAKTRGSQLTAATWDRMMRFLLGAADGVLHSSRNVLGAHLCSQMIRIVFEIYIRSLCFCGPRSELWNILQRFCRRWIHRIAVIEQWNSVCFAITKSFIQRVHSSKVHKTVEIDWCDHRVSNIELSSPLLTYAWYRLFRIVGHPSGITDPDVYLAAIKGIGHLVVELTRMEQSFTSNWGSTSPPNIQSNCENMTMATYCFGESAEAIDAIQKRQSTIRSPPDVNTVLRLVGSWLFDACLVRGPRYAASRCEALRCLGKLICDFGGGKSKRIQWVYSIRCLMAIQIALADEDERVVAAAVVNWSKLFGLFGNHTLRGISVITGLFHSAVERLLSDKARSQSQPDVGNPVLLRRACVETCSSLLTIQTHFPKSLIKEAEARILPPAMSGLPGLYSSLPKQNSANVVALLMKSLKTEIDPTNQQMIMWTLCVAILQETSHWTQGLASSRNSHVYLCVLHICSIITKSGRYKPPVLFTAFDCLRQLVSVAHELTIHAMGSVVLLVSACCEFITTQASTLRSNRAPFYLDSLTALAYKTIMSWVLAAPMLMSKSPVISKVIEAILDGRQVDGNERAPLSWQKHSTSSAEAAQALLSMLMKHHVAGAANLDVNLSRSSIMNEKRILEEMCHFDGIDIHKHCRFFAIQKSAIITIIEKPGIGETGEAICIVRDGNGRYVWRSKPRFGLGPMPKTVLDFEKVNEEYNAKDWHHSDVSESKDDSRYSYCEPEHEVLDPLLQVIRQVDDSSELLSWKSHCVKDPHDAEAVLKNTVSAGEGNTGTDSRKGSTSSHGEHRDGYDAVFTTFIQSQSERDDQSLRHSSQQTLHYECARPKSPVKNKALESFAISRRMLTELGFTSVRNWGKIFALSANSEAFLRDLKELDDLHDRETMEFAILYAINEPSKGGYDHVRILTYQDASKEVASSEYLSFLASMGHRVNLNQHTGFTGILDKQNLRGEILYYTQYDLEISCFVPTLPLCPQNMAKEDLPAPTSLSFEPLLCQMNVLIIWNECQQKYRPGTALWETTYRLPSPLSSMILLINPLENDLYSVQVCQSSFDTTLFGHRDAVSTENEEYLDECELFCARVLGPLQDGMVVNGAWLAPLIRATAINATRISRGYQRYQFSRGVKGAGVALGILSDESNNTTQNAQELLSSCEKKRECVLASVIEKYMCAKLPGEFYGSLFTDVTNARVSEDQFVP